MKLACRAVVATVLATGCVHHAVAEYISGPTGTPNIPGCNPPRSWTMKDGRYQCLLPPPAPPVVNPPTGGGRGEIKSVNGNFYCFTGPGGTTWWWKNDWVLVVTTSQGKTTYWDQVSVLFAASPGQDPDAASQRLLNDPALNGFQVFIDPKLAPVLAPGVMSVLEPTCFMDPNP